MKPGFTRVIRCFGRRVAGYRLRSGTDDKPEETTGNASEYGFCADHLSMRAGWESGNPLTQEDRQSLKASARNERQSECIYGAPIIRLVLSSASPAGDCRVSRRTGDGFGSVFAEGFGPKRASNLDSETDSRETWRLQAGICRQMTSWFLCDPVREPL
jgi:hypothetical protein